MYRSPLLSARCCHVANDLTNCSDDRQTNDEQTEGQKDIAIASPEFMSENLITYSTEVVQIIRELSANCRELILNLLCLICRLCVSC